MFGSNINSDLVLAKSFIPNEYFFNSKHVSSSSLQLKIKAFICIKGSDNIIRFYEKCELDNLYNNLNNYKNLMYLNINTKIFDLYKKNNVESRISFFNLKDYNKDKLTKDIDEYIQFYVQKDYNCHKCKKKRISKFARFISAIMFFLLLFIIVLLFLSFFFVNR